MPNKYLDSVGLAEYTTLIKTALDDKADLASPALTGTPTAPTPTAGDNSTKIATTAFVNTKANDYLPLAGGTMSGALTMNSSSINLGSGVNDNGRIYDINNILRLVGGTNTSTGSYIDVGSSSSGTKGIVLAASDGNGTTKQLKAVYDGTLTWDGKNVERVNATGTNYIRYESGLQMCWGRCATSTSGLSANTFPVAFSAAPKVVAQETPGNIDHTLYMVKLSNVTATGFKSAVTDGTHYQQWVAEYIAVGLWK